MNVLEQMIINHWMMGQYLIFFHELYQYIGHMIDDETKGKLGDYELMIRLDRDKLLQDIKTYERILRGDESDVND